MSSMGSYGSHMGKNHVAGAQTWPNSSVAGVSGAPNPHISPAYSNVAPAYSNVGPAYSNPAPVHSNVAPATYANPATAAPAYVAPVAAAHYGNMEGSILVLFILLVIITRHFYI